MPQWNLRIVKDPLKLSVASITIIAASVTMAERDIVILNADGKAVAVIQLQPGYDTEIVGG